MSDYGSFYDDQSYGDDAYSAGSYGGQSYGHCDDYEAYDDGPHVGTNEAEAFDHYSHDDRRDEGGDDSHCFHFCDDGEPTVYYQDDGHGDYYPGELEHQTGMYASEESSEGGVFGHNPEDMGGHYYVGGLQIAYDGDFDEEGMPAVLSDIHQDLGATYGSNKEELDDLGRNYHGNGIDAENFRSTRGDEYDYEEDNEPAVVTGYQYHSYSNGTRGGGSRYAYIGKNEDGIPEFFDYGRETNGTGSWGVTGASSTEAPEDTDEEPEIVSGHQYHMYSRSRGSERYTYIGRDGDGIPEFIDNGRKSAGKMPSGTVERNNPSSRNATPITRAEESVLSSEGEEPIFVSGHEYHMYSRGRGGDRYAYIGKDEGGVPGFLDYGRKGGRSHGLSQTQTTAPPSSSVASSSRRATRNEPKIVTGHQYHIYACVQGWDRYKYFGKAEDGTPQFLDYGRQDGG